MERKSLQIELKATQPGEMEAVFSRFNVIDLDGDVTLPTAFEAGAPVRLLPAHDWAHYAIGRGTIRVDPDKAVFDGHFNLQTTAGRDWYESVKDSADIQEFSYGFDVLESEPGTVAGQPVRVLKRLKVHEVSPVTLGAGIGTGVLGIKSLGDANAEGEPPDFEAWFAYLSSHPEQASAFLTALEERKKAWVTGEAAELLDAPMEPAPGLQDILASLQRLQTYYGIPVEAR